VRDDVDSRMRRYLISMGVRTACFLGAVAAGGWLRWTLIVSALLLPYLAVVLANGGRDRVEELPPFHDNGRPDSTGGTTLVQSDVMDPAVVTASNRGSCAQIRVGLSSSRDGSPLSQRAHAVRTGEQVEGDSP
jgi:hypothetical protein